MPSPPLIAVRTYRTSDVAEPSDVLALIDAEHDLWHHVDATPTEPGGWCLCPSDEDLTTSGPCTPVPWTDVLEYLPLTVVQLRDTIPGAHQ